MVGTARCAVRTLPSASSFPGFLINFFVGNLRNRRMILAGCIGVADFVMRKNSVPSVPLALPGSMRLAAVLWRVRLLPRR